MQQFFVYAAAALLFLTSCEKRVNGELPYEGDKMVINSLLQPDSVIYIRVTQTGRSSTYSSAGFKELNNAAVELTENGIVLPLHQEKIDGRTWFVSKNKALLGRTYTISAHTPQLGTVTATDTMPPAPDVRMASAPKHTSRVRFVLKDPARVVNYYRIRMFHSEHDGRLLMPRNFRLDPSFSSNIMEVLSDSYHSSLVFTDQRLDGKEITFVLQTEGSMEQEDPTVLEVSTLTESTFRYLSTLAGQSGSGTTILSEPTRVYTNVKNGYGIVGGMNPVRIKVVIE